MELRCRGSQKGNKKKGNLSKNYEKAHCILARTDLNVLEFMRIAL